MPYNRFERQLARWLDSAPRIRALARSGYRRANYLLHAWQAGPPRLHPHASLRMISGGGQGAEDCFFGYFGIQPWSQDGHRHLFHRRRDDDSRSVEICVHDRRTGAVSVLAVSRAWNYQQGAMAQWLLQGGVESVVFNDVVRSRLVSRICTPEGRETTLDWPIQALRPGGASEALSLNYRRLALLRPEYGYADEVDNFSPDQPLESDGLWRVDLRTGQGQLCISLGRLAEAAPVAAGEAQHKINHAVYSPNGTRFVFMHRWFGPRGKFSRLYSANSDGSEPRLLLDHRMVSHYAWRDDDTLLAYARAPEQGDCYYLIDVSTGARKAWCAGTLDRHGDGHPSYSPNREWLITDTYPDRARMSRLLLCSTRDGRVTEVGAFHSPWRFDGPMRCDLHPRWSPDGTEISLDSAHGGRRGVYAVDLSRLVTVHS